MAENLKPTKRKAFSFLRSYFDVFNELNNDEDKLNFLISIINKQFLDEDPKELNFITNLCYESQRHSIEKSIKGWKSIKKTTLLGTTLAPKQAPKQQVEEEEKEEEKVKYIIKEEKIKITDLVKLKQTEKDTLIKKYGIPNYKIMIETLHNYKLSNGKNYKSDYGAINLWVVKAVKEETQIKKNH